MASTTITYAKATAGNPPVFVGQRLRRLANDIMAVANIEGDAGLTGADVTLVTDDVAKTLTVTGGHFPSAQVIQLG
jgi:hypothetical protein